MVKGIVTKSTGSWYEVLGEDGKTYSARLRGKHKIKDIKLTNPIAVGDQVVCNYENDGRMAIDEIVERTNYVIRKSVKKSSQGHIIAANVDQSVLVVTLKYPRTSLGFIDRFLVSCESFRIPAIIVFNKQDIMNEEDKVLQNYLKNIYEKLGYKCLFTSIQTQTGISELNDILEGKTTLFSGHSGVGKSSIINLIAPELDQKVNTISDFAEKGKHTTTFAEMFKIRPDTFIIDTPGIKELGLIEIEPEEISHYFPEMRELLNECKYHNCTHTNEPGCAVKKAVENEEIAEFRYHNYQSMFFNEDNRA
ncbi:MAG TPA: ribosome small subunit-dependent GTPase A [Cytophagales bacterium]|nr:ribosome small subunit-dependent GTPase A [Cytophagales bacterium]